MNKIDAFSKNNPKIIKLLEDISKVIIYKEFVTSNKIIISEKIPSSTYVSNSCFVNEIKDPCIDKIHEKSRIVIQANNNKKNFVLIQLPTI